MTQFVYFLVRTITRIQWKVLYQLPIIYQPTTELSALKPAAWRFKARHRCLCTTITHQQKLQAGLESKLTQKKSYKKSAKAQHSANRKSQCPNTPKASGLLHRGQGTAKTGASGQRRHVNTGPKETTDSYRFLEENPSLGGEHACGQGAKGLVRHLLLPSPAPRAEPPARR